MTREVEVLVIFNIEIATASIAEKAQMALALIKAANDLILGDLRSSAAESISDALEQAEVHFHGSETRH